MNIIEAIQQAENGALITNNFLKLTNSFLKYMGSGVFYQYKLVDDKPVYKYEVRDFSTAYVISIGWEVLPVNYFSEDLDVIAGLKSVDVIAGLKSDENGFWKNGRTIKFKTKEEAMYRLDLMKNSDKYRNYSIIHEYDDYFVKFEKFETMSS